MLAAKDCEAGIDSSSRFPLRRFRHAPRASERAGFITFETASARRGFSTR